MAMTVSRQPVFPAVTAAELKDLPAMSGAVAALAAEYAVAAVKGAAITAQPDVSVKLIQRLPEDLALLRSHVSDFFDSDAWPAGCSQPWAPL